MTILSGSRLVLSGVSPGVAKTVIGIGFAHELRRRGLSVSCVMVGLNLLQAAIYRRITGRYVPCIDDRLLSAGQSLEAVRLCSRGADIQLILGHGGLFDGVEPGLLRGSDAELAKLLRAPTLLLVDPGKLENGLAALVKGFCSFADGFSVAGVVATQLSREENFETRKQALHHVFEAFQPAPLLGVCPTFEAPPSLPARLPQQTERTTALPRQFYLDAGKFVEKFIDLDELLLIAGKAPSVPISDEEEPFSGERRTRIAVADDSCFHICFQDNLELFRAFGAELKSFSPLADTSLPKNIGAVYFPGACLPEYAAELQANTKLRDSIRSFAASGGVVFSEGAGTAYLCREYEAHPGELFQGVGLLNGVAKRGHFQLQPYDVVLTEESPLGSPGFMVKGIHTNEWVLTREKLMEKVLRVSTFDGHSDGEGYSPGAQLVHTFLLLQLSSCPSLAKNIVDAAEVVYRL